MTEKDSLKEKILFAAMECFAEKGFIGASLGDIGKRCNTSSALVCYHFASKEKLAAAVIDYLVAAIKLPRAVEPELIAARPTYRLALKKFVADFLDTFMSEHFPNRLIAPLYRHEAANIREKPVSLHDAILWPVFLELEKLIAAGVADGNSIKTRFLSISVWNILLGYALKDPERVGAYYPEGMPSDLFRQAAIDFIVDDIILPLTARTFATQVREVNPIY